MTPCSAVRLGNQSTFRFHSRSRRLQTRHAHSVSRCLARAAAGPATVQIYSTTTPLHRCRCRRPGLDQRPP